MFARGQSELFAHMPPYSSFCAPTTLLFSDRSAHFQKSAHLIETKLYQNICFHTHAHSFPAFPLITVSCTKHTGGYTPLADGKPKTLLEVFELSPMPLVTYISEIEDGGLKASATNAKGASREARRGEADASLVKT
jgi:hypothetical protein